MRLAVVVPGFSVDEGDWAIPALQSLVVALAKRHEVVVFSVRYPARGRYRFAGIEHYATGGGTRFGGWSLGIMGRTVRAIGRVHGVKPFDVIHAVWVDEPGVVAVIASRWLGVPVVASCGGGELVWLPDIGYGTQGSWFRRWLVGMTLKRAQVVTAGSGYQAGLVRGQGREQVVVAPLGVDMDRFCPHPNGLPKGVGNRGWTLVQAASLTGVKDQALLLAVLQLVKGRIPAVRLRLVGEGVLRAELEAEARQLGVYAQVIWQDRVAFGEMPAVFQCSDLYVQTSRHESQGMAVLEAMACGVPAIGTPVGVLPAVGALPAETTAEGLTGQVVALWEDGVLYGEKCRQARRLVVRDYSLVGSVGRFEAIYTQLSTKV